MGEGNEMVDFDAGEVRVTEWEEGLPREEELMPLSQTLFPPLLASAFSIVPEPCRSMLDVDRATQNTIRNLRRRFETGVLEHNWKTLPTSSMRDGSFVLEDDGGNGGDDCSLGEENEGKKGRRYSEGDMEEAESGLRPENSHDEQSARALKRPRLVWTPQLHKRFVDVVGHLGIKNAVPKTIMQLMNVEGLTRENVASHLQKYRLYLKRMQGLPNEGPSSSDQLFSSTPVTNSIAGRPYAGSQREESSKHMPVPMPYAAPFVPMPVVGVAHGHGPPAMPIVAPGVYNGFETHPCSGSGRYFVPQRILPGDQQREWSCNTFQSVMPYPYVTPNNK
ncbi:transcription factor PCL1-like [Nymphaea colorata]|uniref:transcription factor PCL1-like n=1 Tax=Nymphaea colorata TaxID=210225 RepID=UPI00129DDDAA|nr:transcription factor PCL1-like [Nymphaea colorata]